MKHEDAVSRIRERLRESSRVLQGVAEGQADALARAAGLIERSLRDGGRFFTCGNGGSAADAQHIAAELSGRFYLNRAGLAAVALTVNSSALTAIGNDFGYEQVFARQLEGLARPGDVLLAITTSGTSANVLRAVERARGLGLVVIGFTGERGGDFAARCDAALVVASADTARIQEAHIASGHLLCELVEDAMFGGAEA